MKYDTYQEKKNDDTITAIIAIGNLKNEAKYLEVAELKSEIRCDACLVLFVYLLSLPLRQLPCSYNKQRNRAACGGDTPGPSNGARTRTVKDHSVCSQCVPRFYTLQRRKARTIPSQPKIRYKRIYL